VTWAVVKRQLAVEDHLEVEAGSAVEGNVTPGAFVVAALELEEAQWAKHNFHRLIVLLIRLTFQTIPHFGHTENVRR
jgi:hypothetical protein